MKAGSKVQRWGMLEVHWCVGHNALQIVPVRLRPSPWTNAVSLPNRRRRGIRFKHVVPNEVVVQRLPGQRAACGPCHGGACVLGEFQQWRLLHPGPGQRSPALPFLRGRWSAPGLTWGGGLIHVNSMKTQWGGSQALGPVCVCVSQRHPQRWVGDAHGA